MKKAAAKKVSTLGKKLAQKGKALKGKASTTARKLTKSATSAASKASQRLKTKVKKTKQSASVRKAGKLGRAVGTMVGRAINTAENLVTGVIKKK